MQTFSNIPLQIPTDKVDLIVSIIKDIGKNMKIQVKELSTFDDKNTILKQKIQEFDSISGSVKIDKIPTEQERIEARAKKYVK